MLARASSRSGDRASPLDLRLRRPRPRGGDRDWLRHREDRQALRRALAGSPHDRASAEERAITRISTAMFASAPSRVIDRLPGTPEVEGWVAIDAELRYTAETPIPDVSGHLEAEGIRVERFSFARAIQSDFSVRRSIVTSRTRASRSPTASPSSASRGEPLAKGSRSRWASSMSPESASPRYARFHVSLAPARDVGRQRVKVAGFNGDDPPAQARGRPQRPDRRIRGLRLAVDSPNKTRATGVKEGILPGKVAATPTALEFRHVRVNTTHSSGRRRLRVDRLPRDAEGRDPARED